MKTHHYEVRMDWTGNGGEGTKNYRSYRRDHEISANGKVIILASSDPAFRGDPTRYNPEELLVGSISSCHMLWYLHLCAVNGVMVLDYHDDARGEMNENTDGSGEFVRVVLRPKIRIAGRGDIAKANALHHEAHKYCFIARSVKFPVEIDASIATNGGSE
jgi:organic hydroperoxide reductase OsmC/OhrA